MDASTFLMAFRRFISRRGKPFELLSDCGTNFKAGEAELQGAFKAMTPDVQKELAHSQVNFRFNPPSAPHFGGSWEREIKFIKMALNSAVGSQTTSEPILHTVLVEVESILNSKPLGYVSSGIADLDPVAPNVLLMGRPDASLPQAIYCKSDLLSQRKWRHNQFWTAFLRHCLPNFQGSQKWRTDQENLDTGQVVMVIDPRYPRALWPVGRITKTHPGKDVEVRSATVAIKGHEYLRPVSRLILLPEMDK